MAHDIYQEIDMHGNYLNNARVKDDPSDPESVAPRKYVDQSLIQIEGADGFIEAKPHVKKILFKNSEGKFLKRVIENEPYTMYVVIDACKNSRSSFSIESDLIIRTDYGEVVVNRFFTHDSQELPTDITINRDEILFVFHSSDIVNDEMASSMRLNNIISMEVSINYPSKTIEFANHQVTHEKIEILVEYGDLSDFMFLKNPVVVGQNMEEHPEVDDRDTMYIEELKNVRFSRSKTNEITFHADTATEKNFLVLFPLEQSSEFFCQIFYEEKPLTEKIPVVIDSNGPVFTWLGTPFIQNVVNLGYLGYVPSSGTTHEIEFTAKFTLK